MMWMSKAVLTTLCHSQKPKIFVFYMRTLVSLVMRSECMFDVKPCGLEWLICHTKHYTCIYELSVVRVELTFCPPLKEEGGLWNQSCVSGCLAIHLAVCWYSSQTVCWNFFIYLYISIRYSLWAMYVFSKILIPSIITDVSDILSDIIFPMF